MDPAQPQQPQPKPVAAEKKKRVLTVEERNKILFGRMNHVLANASDPNWVGYANKLAQYLSDPRGYYTEARKDVLKLLAVAEVCLKTDLGMATNENSKVTLLPEHYRDHPLGDAYTKLVSAIHPHINLFVEPDLKEAARYLLFTVGIQVPDDPTNSPSSAQMRPAAPVVPTSVLTSPRALSAGSRSVPSSVAGQIPMPGPSVRDLFTNPIPPSTTAAITVQKVPPNMSAPLNPAPPMPPTSTPSPSGAAPQSSQPPPAPSTSTTAATTTTATTVLTRVKKKKKTDISTLQQRDLERFKQRQASASSASSTPTLPAASPAVATLTPTPGPSASSLGAKNVDLLPDSLASRTPVGGTNSTSSSPPQPPKTEDDRGMEVDVPAGPGPSVESGIPETQPRGSSKPAAATVASTDGDAMDIDTQASSRLQIPSPITQPTTGSIPASSPTLPATGPSTQPILVPGASKTPSVTPPLPSNGPSPVPGDTDAKSTQAKTDSQPPVQTAQPTLTLQPTLPSVPRMQSQPVEGPSIPSGLSSVPNASSTSGTSADIDFRTSAKSMTLMGPHNNVVRSQTVPIVSQLPRQPPVGSMLPPPVPVPKSTQSLTQPNARGLPTSVLAQTSGPRPSQPPVQPNVGRPTQVTLVAPAQEPPPKENENAMQIDKPPVPPPAPPVAKIPPEQIFGHSDIPRITLLGFEKGKKERGTIPFKFKLSSIQVDLLQKWKKQAGTLEELACTVSVSLGCYLIESLKPPSSFLEQIAIMPSTFAQDGGLSMRFEGVGSPPESVTLPLSPPFLSTPDGRFDLSSLICKPGPHSFEIIQSRDWSQYAFVLFLHHPTASQMKKAEERKRKDREWEEWKARVSKPPLMTVPKLKVG
ncbi:hypothetical protein CC1G_05178 [Coprinopsis cinerea okayama7|uniref:Uncharacterized protein n=1 Tax=Coprinopsis cinerea (strain Okayama-7 / 130 / ATCC MYA-4618 / FGSC 9003) TaxID=240176 RepID=A8NG53_COPC7|nr:hypothetical protein CC1G_05178 [Coprinopsis cinerea okayama7\|eukprot:XP_001833478.2 hypothetical protein CC1G_05178 [Coprinopsis cinerea okayama7\